MAVMLEVPLASAQQSEQAAEVRQLPSIQVAGALDQEQTEQSGSYAAQETSRSTGLSLSPRETPQSVTVVTRQRLDDIDAKSIGDVMGNTAGITLTEMDNGARTTYRARGFSISNYKLDGLDFNAQSDFGGVGGAVNMDLYDSVAIVRGANGLLGGLGDPSATIDMVRKRPLRELGGSLKLYGGSWRYKRGVADVSVPFADGKVRSRVVVSGQDAGSFREREQNKRIGVLASVEADITDRTVLGAGYQYENAQVQGASWGANVPIWFADGSPTEFDRSFNPVADWSRTERTARTIFARLDHQFAQGWRAQVNWARTSVDSLNNMGVVKVNNGAVVWPHWRQDGSGAYLNGIHSEAESVTNAFSASVSGPLRLLGRDHELLFGINGSRTDGTNYNFTSANCGIQGIPGFRGGCQYRTELPVNDWRTWNGGQYSDYAAFRTNARTETRTQLYGAYLTGRFSLTDNLTTVAGVRLSRYKTYAHDYGLDNNRGPRKSSNDAQQWTPYFGVVYDFAQNYSAYASYTNIFTPQTSRNVDGDVIDPIRGDSFELGVKSVWMDGRLNGSLALFRSQLKNVAVVDNGKFVVGTDREQAYTQGSGRRVQGVDVELDGEVLPGWNVAVGYTYQNVTDRDTDERVDPKHVFRLTTAYRLPGDWNRLTVGGGVSWQSHTVSAPYPGRPLPGGKFDASNIRVKGYAVVNLMARYQVNDNLTATLHVNNLFDKTYTRQYGFYNGLIYGEPRRITLGLQARF